MSERRYSQDEVSEIFARTLEKEHAALPAPTESNGLTLAALQEIGREVGISAESISQAARSLDQAPQSTAKTFLGLPIGVGQTVEFDRPLSDSDWERLVGDLRTTFNARGAVRYDGPFRQWTNGNLQALLEPTATGHRLRLQTSKGDARALMTGGGIVLGGATATFIALTVAGTLGKPGSLMGIGFMALMGLGMFAAGALRVPRWARLRKTQIDEIIARLVRSTEPSV
jgi:hypothetical protein